MNRIGKKITALFSAAALLTGTGAVTAFAAAAPAAAETVSAAGVADSPQLKAYAQSCMELEKTPGMALVTVSGRDAAFQNWGYANIVEAQNVTNGTVFELASLSKAFTALAVLLLQEEGKLSLADSVSDYFSWWNVTYQGKSADVKIWQLLNHCAGIPNGKTMAKMPFGADDSLKEKTARIVEGMELAYAPGTQFEYCNEDYNILAYLTETVSGMPFDQYVTQEIFVPLGMERSGYDLATAQGYRYLFGEMIEYDAPRMKGCEGDGFALSASEDMGYWIMAQTGTLENVPEKLANAIKASHELPEERRIVAEEGDFDGTGPKPLYYVNGWIQNEDGSFIMHTGLNPNFTSVVLIDRAEQNGVFAAANAWVDSAQNTANAAYKLLHGGSAADFSPESRSASYQADRYAFYALIAEGAAVLVICMVILTQKRRMLRQQRTTRAETVLLVLRMLLLLPLLAAALGAPYLLGQLIGYPGFNYRMLTYWLPLSIPGAFAGLDVVILMLISACISRYKKALRGYW